MAIVSFLPVVIAWLFPKRNGVFLTWFTALIGVWASMFFLEHEPCDTVSKEYIRNVMFMLSIIMIVTVAFYLQGVACRPQPSSQ
jgi:hypothetical protein